MSTPTENRTRLKNNNNNPIYPTPPLGQDMTQG